ncbi:MAG: hypothetical protein ACUVSX_12295 [Aggregatilineales bacterium]
MHRIPERSPIGDLFPGLLLRSGDLHALALETAPFAELVASGPLMVRYAVEYLGKPHLAVVPGLIALDYGDILAGEAAWDFLLHRSNLYPRADVIGYRTDGADDMVQVKWLDLAQPVQVWAYKDDQAVKPIARVTALIAAAELNPDLPPRLLEYLPCFASAADWLAARG